MRYLGVDYGEKRFGLSTSDPLLLTAQARGFIPAEISGLAEYILKFSAECGELTVVVGLPKNLKGEIAKTAEKVLKFVEKLKTRLAQSGLPIKVETFDERFSSLASEKTLIAAGVSRQKRKLVVDGMAAAYMLQGYLDQIKK